MSEIRSYSRCSLGFFPSHGNQKLCPSCRAGRKALPHDWWHGKTFGVRRCDLCSREFAARLRAGFGSARRWRFAGQTSMPPVRGFVSPLRDQDEHLALGPAPEVAHGRDRENVPARGPGARAQGLSGAQLLGRASGDVTRLPPREDSELHAARSTASTDYALALGGRARAGARRARWALQAVDEPGRLHARHAGRRCPGRTIRTLALILGSCNDPRPVGTLDGSDRLGVGP
jgi:hypothetical protein